MSYGLPDQQLFQLSLSMTQSKMLGLEVLVSYSTKKKAFMVLTLPIINFIPGPPDRCAVVYLVWIHGRNLNVTEAHAESERTSTIHYISLCNLQLWGDVTTSLNMRKGLRHFQFHFKSALQPHLLHNLPLTVQKCPGLEMGCFILGALLGHSSKALGMDNLLRKRWWS